MQIKNFEDLEIWQAARRLAQEIYTCSRSPKFSKDFRFARSNATSCGFGHVQHHRRL